jgi:arabinose-5-phosphate isomerase
MRKGTGIPIVTVDARVREAIMEITEKHLGMTAVLDQAGRVAGIFTDGDVRRSIGKVTDLDTAKITDVMSPAPHIIRPDALAVAAVELMERHKINQLLVVDDAGHLVGALNMHDLFRAKVV